jgi:hypothetical protein
MKVKAMRKAIADATVLLDQMTNVVNTIDRLEQMKKPQLLYHPKGEQVTGGNGVLVEHPEMVSEAMFTTLDGLDTALSELIDKVKPTLEKGRDA